VVGKVRFRLVIPVSSEMLGRLKEGNVIDNEGMLKDGKLVSKLVDGTLRLGSESDTDGRLIDGRPVSRLVEGTDTESEGRLIESKLIEGKPVPRLVEGRLRLGSETVMSVGRLRESEGKLMLGAEIEGRPKDVDGNDKDGSEKLVEGTLSVGIARTEIEGDGSAKDVLGNESDRSVGRLAEKPVGGLRLRLGTLNVGKLTEMSVGRLKLRLGEVSVGKLRDKSVGRLRLKLGNVSDGTERLAEGNAGIDKLVEGTFGRLVGNEILGSVSPVGNETLPGVEIGNPESPSVKLFRGLVAERVTVTAGGTKVTVTASQTSVLMFSDCHPTRFATDTYHST